MPVERRHAGAHRRLDPAVARPGHLGGDDQRIARLGLHPAADDFLGAARVFRIGRHRIVFGGVVEIDAGVEASVENFDRGFLVGHRAERHRAHADFGDDDAAAAQTIAFHERSLRCID